jgi:uncharacterized protein
VKVIIDTNVLISAILKDRVPEELILFIVRHGKFEWFVTDEILEEYFSVMKRRKFNLSSDIIRSWETLIVSHTTNIGSIKKTHIKFPRDINDEKFLACSIVSNSDFLITGDEDFKSAIKLVNTKIISVSLFKKIFF